MFFVAIVVKDKEKNCILANTSSTLFPVFSSNLYYRFPITASFVLNIYFMQYTLFKCLL